MSHWMRVTHPHIVCVLGVLDTQSTQYNSGKREPKAISSNANDMIGVVDRQELSEIKVYGQIDSNPTDRHNQKFTGKEENNRTIVSVDFQELVRSGLVDTNGRVEIRTNSRLLRLEDRKGNVMESFSEIKRSLYLHEIENDWYIHGRRGITSLIFRNKPRN